MTTNQPRGSRGTTEVKTAHYSFEWTIKSFKLLTQKCGEFLWSPIFRVGPNGEGWRLKLYPRGMKEETRYVCLYIHLMYPIETTGITVKCNFSILKSNTLLCPSPKDDIVGTFQSMSGQGVGLIDIEKLLEELKTDDTFTILCEIDQAMETVTKLTNSVSFNLENDRLTDDCRKLSQHRNEFSDVTIIVEDKRFPAHKFLLAARSSVFATMFRQAEMKENRTNEVEIEDLEPEIVEAMLEFIYTDDVTNITGLADRLLAAAHKYEVERLKRMCEETLYNNLTTDNASDILVLADFYSSDQLLQLVIDFMCEHSREVVESESYKNISDPELLRKIMHKMATR